MHVITICPRCKKDFMYHTTDYHLWRPVAWDEKGEPVSFEKICQECDEKEQASVTKK